MIFTDDLSTSELSDDKIPLKIILEFHAIFDQYF